MRVLVFPLPRGEEVVAVASNAVGPSLPSFSVPLETGEQEAWLGVKEREICEGQRTASRSLLGNLGKILNPFFCLFDFYLQFYDWKIVSIATATFKAVVCYSK
jgi:hypothetical protein